MSKKHHNAPQKIAVRFGRSVAFNLQISFRRLEAGFRCANCATHRPHARNSRTHRSWHGEFLSAGTVPDADRKQLKTGAFKNMKKTNNTTARGWANQRSVITQNKKAALVMAVCLLAGAGFSGAQAAPDNQPGSDSTAITTSTNTAPAGDTNSPVASLAADLQGLKARIEASVAAMSNAVASSPALQAAKVTKLADEITELGTKDLGNEGEIVKEAESLIAKLDESLAKARKGSSDPNVDPSAREIYDRLLPSLESERTKLIHAKSTAAGIRTVLFRQAEELRQWAEAIEFAEHCNQLVPARARHP